MTKNGRFYAYNRLIAGVGFNLVGYETLVVFKA